MARDKATAPGEIDFIDILRKSAGGRFHAMLRNPFSPNQKRTTAVGAFISPS